MNGAASLGGVNGDGSHLAVEHLAAAADHLGAGRDVLQSHFARGPFGTSYWAPVVASPPMRAALVSAIDLPGELIP